MSYDAIVVGGGIAGLTTAAYLSRGGSSVLLCEKEDKLGGLVNSFQYNGFVFDGGIRAIENSGIVMPMLRQLGIQVDFIKSPVTVGIGDDYVLIDSELSLQDYRDMLIRQFPDNHTEIEAITEDIHRIMKYLDVLYGIDNPLFLDMMHDRNYLLKTILPWMFKYLLTIPKIQKLNTPVDEYLYRFTQNQVLIDMIAQHFFQKTPAFFALSYFSLYLDYQYPKGGTGTLPALLEQFITNHGGKLLTNTEIQTVQPHSHQIIDTQGQSYSYRKLIWAADTKRLYHSIDNIEIQHRPYYAQIRDKEQQISDKTGSDSILSVYMTVDLAPEYFASICSPHFFYTPIKEGLSKLDTDIICSESQVDTKYVDDENDISHWIHHFLKLTTYEISIPAMRDPTLAPEGQTGLIVSTLFPYDLTTHIESLGWYDRFKERVELDIIDVLDSSVFPGLKEKTTAHFSSTPLTLARKTGNTDGAITGWAFTNDIIPAVHSMPRIASSVLTPIPDILQAGQWTYSPSGLPISVLTGKLAADRALRELKRQG